jgi:hypothetical protein
MSKFYIEYRNRKGEMVRKILTAQSQYHAVQMVCKIKGTRVKESGHCVNFYDVYNPYNPNVVIKRFYVAAR